VSGELEDPRTHQNSLVIHFDLAVIFFAAVSFAVPPEADARVVVLAIAGGDSRACALPRAVIPFAPPVALAAARFVVVFVAAGELPPADRALVPVVPDPDPVAALGMCPPSRRAGHRPAARSRRPAARCR
jgi:hypothetical protein